MKTIHLTLKAVAVASIAVASGAAFATNGMNMEAYGAKAGGMGGASMAYDNGNSAVMNNPATLVLGKEGSDFGIGFTHLGPDVGASMSIYNITSAGDSYKMPSMSWIKKSGNVAFGAAMLAQGGMGTEYGNNTFMSPSGKTSRSEVAFGRLMAPLAYKVNDQMSIAGQVDFVWGSMDMQMDMMANSMAAGMAQGSISGSGSLFGVDGFMNNLRPTGQQLTTAQAIDNGYARFNFSNSNAYTGAAIGSGFGGKIGMHFQVNKDLSVGATYHSETSLSDLKGRGTLESGTMGAGSTYVTPGEFYVRDFQWPSTVGIGMAWNANSKLMIVADYKRINWSKTMDKLSLGFVSDSNQTLEISMDQKWSDQDVYMIGAQYKVTDSVAVRVGYNYSKNPIGNNYLNPLFPAIVETHYTFGMGWQLNPTNSVAFSMTHAPKVTQTNPYGGYDSTIVTNTAASPIAVTSTHSQTTWRINYNYHF